MEEFEVDIVGVVQLSTFLFIAEGILTSLGLWGKPYQSAFLVNDKFIGIEEAIKMGNTHLLAIFN